MYKLLLPVLFLALFAVACDSREDLAELPQGSLTVDTEALVAEWHALASAENGDLDIEAAHQIAGQLSRTVGGLDPLFDVMANPESDPLTKVLVVISTTPFITEAHAPMLIELTDAAHEQTTRSCATNLLGQLDDHAPAAARLHELKDQEANYTVRLAAILSLMKQRDAEALEMAPEIWEHPDTTDEQRTQIVYLMPNSRVYDFFDLFKDAAVNPNIEFSARMRAVSVVAQADDPSALPILEQVAREDSSEDIRRLATRGRIAMAERFGEAIEDLEEVDLEDADEAETDAPE